MVGVGWWWSEPAVRQHWEVGGVVEGFEGWAALLTALAAGSANVTPQKWQDGFTPARLSSTLTLPLVE